MIQVACKQCWFLFEARRSNAKYCSPACKQKAHRIAKGQKAANKKASRTPNDRAICRHCGDGFWQSGKGRKAHYCSQSCRQMANIAKKHAGFNWYKQARGISDYEAWNYIEAVGTDAIDRLAAAEGLHYSYPQRMYIRTETYFSLDPLNFGFVKA